VSILLTHRYASVVLSLDPFSQIILRVLLAYRGLAVEPAHLVYVFGRYRRLPLVYLLLLNSMRLMTLHRFLTVQVREANLLGFSVPRCDLFPFIKPRKILLKSML